MTTAQDKLAAKVRTAYERREQKLADAKEAYAVRTGKADEARAAELQAALADYQSTVAGIEAALTEALGPGRGA